MSLISQKAIKETEQRKERECRRMRRMRVEGNRYIKAFISTLVEKVKTLIDHKTVWWCSIIRPYIRLQAWCMEFVRWEDGCVVLQMKRNWSCSFKIVLLFYFIFMWINYNMNKCDLSTTHSSACFLSIKLLHSSYLWEISRWTK